MGAKAGKPAPPRKPPQPRTGLDFDQQAVQGKLQALNAQNIWPGSHPLDESALAAVLRVSAGRGMEILDEAEDKGVAGQLRDPSAFVRRAVALEEAGKGPR